MPKHGVVVVVLLVALASGATARNATPASSTETFTCTVPGSLPLPPPTRPHYALTVRVGPRLRLVTGTLDVRFAPEQATDRIVFRLWANSGYSIGKGGRLTVGDVRAAGRPVRSSRPNPTTLVVERALQRGEAIALSMTWRLRLPLGATDRLYGGPVARLGSFFPLLAWNPRAGWQMDRGSAIGWETWTSPTADFDVRVAAPRGLRVVASGEQVGPTPWRARAVRDFALAVGRFRVVRGTAAAPRRVRLTVAVHGASLSAARQLLERARAALEEHARRFGPYPWRTFAVAGFDLDRFSWEYPTLIFASTTDPDPGPGLLAHEVGHQWFYSLVGNNQARDPWLDETLATWAQARFANNVDRIAALPVPEAVRNQLGQPMLFWDAFSIPTFIAGAYNQGVQALASLGDPEVVDCALRLYALRNAYGIAAPADLLVALEEFFPEARQKLEAYGARF